MPIDPITGLEVKPTKQPPLNLDVNSLISNFGQGSKDFKHYGQANVFTSDFNRNKLNGDEAMRGALNLEQLSAERQSAGELALKGLGRFAGKAVTEVLKMPGYIGGSFGSMIDGITGGRTNLTKADNFTQSVAENSWVNAFSALDETIKEAIPVHQTEQSKTGGFTEWVFDGSFWATQGADGLGYIASFLVPGAATKILKLGSAGTKLYGKGIALVGAETKLGKGLFAFDKLVDIEKTIDIATATAMSTTFEAASEAKEAMDNYRAKMANSGLSPEEIEAKAAKVGENVFATNFGILLLPNLMTNKILLGHIKANKLDNLFTSKFDDAGKFIMEPIVKTGKQKALQYGETAALGVLGEGFWEEGMQTTMSNYIQNNPDYDWRDFIENAPDIARSYMETLGSTEGQQAVFLGALFGSVMGTGQSFIQNKQNEKSQNTAYDLYSKNYQAFQNYISVPFSQNEKGEVIYVDGKATIDEQKLDKALISLHEQLNSLEELSYLQNLNKEDKFEKYVGKALLSIALPAANVENGAEIVEHQLKGLQSFLKSKLSEESSSNLTSNEYFQKQLNRIKKIQEDATFFNKFLSEPLTSVKTTHEKGDTLKGDFIKGKAYEYSSLMDSLDFFDIKINEIESSINKVKQRTNNEELSEEETLPFLTTRLSDLKEEKADVLKVLKQFRSKKEMQSVFNEFIADYDELQELIQKQKEIVETSKEKELETKKEETAEITEKSNKEIQKEKALAAKAAKAALKEEKALAKKKGVETTTEEPPTNNETEDAFKDLHEQGTPTPSFEDLLKTSPEDIANSGQFETVTGDNVELQDKHTDILEEDDYTDETSTNDNVELNNNLDKNTLDAIKHNTTAIQALNTVGFKIFPNIDDNFIEWLGVSRNKRGEVLTFDFGDWNITASTKEAYAAWERVKKGNNATQDADIAILKKQIPLVIKTSTGAIGIVNKPNDKYPSHVKMHSDIVDLLLSGVDITSIETKVNFQKGGSLNIDVYANNSILDLEEFENDISKVNLLFADSTGSLVNDNLEQVGVTLNSKNKGGIFTLITKRNGEKFPLKLNRRFLNDVEANSIIGIYREIMKEQSLTIENTLKDIKNEQVRNYIYDNFKELLPLMNKNIGEIQVGEFLDMLVAEGLSNKPNRLVYNSKKNLLYIGTQAVKDKDSFIFSAEDFNNKEAIAKFKKWMMLYKRRNVKTKAKKYKNSTLTINNKEYLKHLLVGADKVLSTDVATKDKNNVQQPMFIGDYNIWVESNVTVNNKPKEVAIQEQILKPVEKTTRDKIFSFTSQKEYEKKYNQEIEDYLMPLLPKDSMGNENLEEIKKIIIDSENNQENVLSIEEKDVSLQDNQNLLREFESKKIPNSLTAVSKLPEDSKSKECVTAPSTK